MFKYQQEKQKNQENGKASDRTQNYRPAVPISVYRELAKELQTTKGELEAVKQQNHQLTHENKLMRQELDKITQCVQTFQQVQEEARDSDRSAAALDRVAVPARSGEARSSSAQPIPVSPPLEPAFEEMDRNEEYAIEIEEPSKNQRFSLLDSSGDISGWLLAIAIALMVLTAFGAGFLFVRPWLLNNGNNN